MVLKEFLRKPGQTGAIWSSSPGLAQLMADQAQLEKREMVVEFGPGTSAFTREIIQRLPQQADFFALETNAKFVHKTRQRCPQARVYHASAEEIQHYLAHHQRSSCDCIISGLPWASFPPSQQQAILQAAHRSLAPGGLFLTFAYAQGKLLPGSLRFKRLLENTFSSVSRTRTFWSNLPPAFIYKAYK